MPEKSQLPPKDMLGVDNDALERFIGLDDQVGSDLKSSGAQGDGDALVKTHVTDTTRIDEGVWDVQTLPENVTRDAVERDRPDLGLTNEEEASWLDFFDAIRQKANPWFVGAAIAAVLLTVAALALARSGGGPLGGAPAEPLPSSFDFVSSMTFLGGHVPFAPPCEGLTVKVTIDVTGTPAGTPVVVAFTGAGLPAQDTFTSGTTYTRLVPAASGSSTWTSQIVSIGGKALPSNMNTQRHASC